MLSTSPSAVRTLAASTSAAGTLAAFDTMAVSCADLEPDWGGIALAILTSIVLRATALLSHGHRSCNGCATIESLRVRWKCSDSDVVAVQIRG